MFLIQPRARSWGVSPCPASIGCGCWSRGRGAPPGPFSAPSLLGETFSWQPVSCYYWQEIPPAPHPFPGRDLFFCLFSWLWVSPCAVGVHRAAALPPVAEDTTLLRVLSPLFAFSRQPVPQAHPEGRREARERGP